MSSWVIAPRAPQEFIEALKAAGIDPLAGQMLHARGVRSLEEAQAFLEPTRRARPVEIFGLVDLRLAVDRILAAIDGGEPIVVYGDYDCDGVTACALMHHTLAALGASFLAPARYRASVTVLVEAGTANQSGIDYNLTPIRSYTALLRSPALEAACPGIAPKVSVRMPENTRLLEVSVDDREARSAADVANCLVAKATGELSPIHV